MSPSPRLARRSGRSWLAALMAVILGTAGAVVGASPALADLGDDGQISLNKTVDLLPAITAAPGDSFTYELLVGCDDNPCIDAVLDDQLPPEFEGFKIEALSVFPGSAPVTATLSGCTVGGDVTSLCELHADFAAPLGELEGVEQFGIDAGVTYRVDVELTVPLDLAPDWAYNGVPVVNTATADALTSVEPRNDSATVTVEIAVEVDVAATKSWSPTSQLYFPGTESSFTIGAQNTSNVSAQSLVMQDPSVAPADAPQLDATNPFTFVDFVGLCSPSDLPEGADLVQVDLYVQPNPGDPWNWVIGSPAATATLPSYSGEVGGLRLTYTSTGGATITASGGPAAQCVTVEQRSTNRTTSASLVLGATVDNTVLATVTVPDQDPVTDQASAALTIGGLNVIVTPGKTIAPEVIPAGHEFTVTLTAKNDSNGPLTSLTITEPAPSTGAFLSDDLSFGHFTAWNWPAGATGGTFTWHFNTAPDQVDSTITDLVIPTVPTPGAGDWITGFTVTYTGEIAAGTTGSFAFTVNSDPNMIDTDDEVTPFYDDFLNVVEVSGTNPAGTDTGTAQDGVRIYAPEIELTIDKTIRPTLVVPGGTVVAELSTRTASSDARVNPTQIVVEDVWDGTPATDFWDAFRDRELAFIQIPSDSTLTVRYTTETPVTDPVTWIDIVVGATGTGGY